MENNKRITWVDTAKGVGIILVVFFHMNIKQLPGMVWGGVRCGFLYDILFYHERLIL